MSLGSKVNEESKRVSGGQKRRGITYSRKKVRRNVGRKTTEDDMQGEKN